MNHVETPSFDIEDAVQQAKSSGSGYRFVQWLREISGVDDGG